MNTSVGTQAIWQGLNRRKPLALLLAASTVLAACEEGKSPQWMKPRAQTETTESAAPSNRSVKLVERDVEAPEVFQVTSNGLWDGRPSLGGVWVAHPDVKDPERVLIRNEKNGKFVIGALFRRERENPGPKLQVSSDAAAAIGMLAGQPAKLNVTALRRETVADGPEPQAAPQLDAPGAITEATLAPAAMEAAAVKNAAGQQSAPADLAKPVATAAPAPAPKPKAKASGLDKPYIQLGIFSVEQNAKNTAAAMRVAGLTSEVKKSSSSGKTFWRVLVGPAQTTAERKTMMKKVKASGFTDAYAVRR